MHTITCLVLAETQDDVDVQFTHGRKFPTLLPALASLVGIKASIGLATPPYRRLYFLTRAP